MFKIQLKGLEVDPNIDWDKLANMTDMYSGADITSVCREASYTNETLTPKKWWVT